MRRNPVRRKPMAEINIVPYIDVMLVLLVIFMITAPLLTQGVDVKLPSAKAQVIADNTEKPIIVSVDDHGLYYLNIAENPSQPIAAAALISRVAGELQIAEKAQKKRLVLVKGDRNVSYGKVVQAMILLQQAGAANVGLMTEPPKLKS